MPHHRNWRSILIANQPRIALSSDAPSSVTFHATLHPLERSMLCNAPCSETPNQRMRRVRELVFLGWLHGRSANRRMRQMAGLGKSHDRRHRSYGRMWRLRGRDVISRSICKLHGAAICMIDHFTRDRQMRGRGHFTHCRRFSQIIFTLCLILANAYTFAITTIYSMWLVQNLNLKTATFQVFFCQSHQNQAMLQWSTCAQETPPIMKDISRCKCRIVS